VILPSGAAQRRNVSFRGLASTVGTMHAPVDAAPDDVHVDVEVDVAVVGSGPAGTAAAITAADRGLRVWCADKAMFPRDKTCGDGLTTNALRLIERLGLTRDAFNTLPAARVRETILVSPSGRRVALPLPSDGDYAAVVARVDLDAALVGLARGRGIEIREGCAVEGVTTGQHAIELATTDGTTVAARYVIAADGHWSTVRRALHPDAARDLGEWHAARQYFAGVRDDRLWVIFDEHLLPGYAWVFPLPHGRANVGFGVVRADGRTGRELKALWPQVLDLPAIRDALGPRAQALDAVRAWPIPARYQARRLADANGRVLYVGDAASIVDPMTGEGIAQAIETGMLAADAIARGGDVQATYRQSVHRTLGRDLRFAGWLQAVLRHPLGARAAIRAAGLTAWTRRNFARWMWEDYPRALLGTPDRWGRGAFTTPGAYRVPS
jgi:geranylgeranyl reductase family protein